ncbi:MAG: SWIM zinc finger family protein [Kofleriaceae bacterium]
MRVDFKYRGRSQLREVDGVSAMTFEPNLSRAKVFFDAELIDPVRFREAISALHEVVIGDLKFKKRDKTAYKRFLAEREKEDQALRDQAFDKAKAAELKRIAKQPMPPTLERDFRKMHRQYWRARTTWANELARNDPALFRALVPCDPVVTVAPDVVMFECFAKDESSYGCLSVDREAFRGAGDAGLGTTNVDYSIALYDHFQTLRTYRPTRLLVDPTGFEVQAGAGDSGSLREEKIDLPASWLRGFGQLQAAMALPARRFELSTDVVYSLLAYLKRHRETKGPRSLQFVLETGKPPKVIIEPWGVPLVSRGAAYQGPTDTIKVWGRRRLMAFARTLPLAETFDVQLLGTGLPSVWVARMGELRMTIALSGWTANDWSGASALDQYFGGFESKPVVVDRLANHLESQRSATLSQLVAVSAETEKVVLGSLHTLAKRGQLAYDFATGIYRWRPILDAALSDLMIGPEPEEIVEGKKLVNDVTIARREPVGAKQLVTGNVKGTSCEALIDLDGVFTRAKCSCSFFHRMRLRAGPCRHLLALRLHVIALDRPPSAKMTHIDSHPYR